jgi:excisionase family DNA binding protein
MNDQSPTVLHTTEEAATLLRVKRSWLARQAAKRRIPFVMLGGCYRFTNDHIAAIIAQFENTPFVSAPTPIGAARTSRAKDTAPRAAHVAPLRPRPRKTA